MASCTPFRFSRPARHRLASPLLASLALAGAVACGGGRATQPDAGSPASPPSAAAPPRAPAAAGDDAYFVRCAGEVTDLADIVGPIAEELTAQRIPYGRGPDVTRELRDCSGNFLRLSSRVAERCPEAAPFLAAPAGVEPYDRNGNNEFAHFDRIKARASRGIGRWYHQQGRFTAVFYDDAGAVSDVPQDLAQVRDLIRPGAVVWFSRVKPLEADGTAPFWGDGRERINHMGTVTQVERDDDGNVVRYSIYHGHGEDNTPADVTHHHYWEWPDALTDGGAKEYPPFGYWKQYLVGVGRLVPTTESG